MIFNPLFLHLSNLVSSDCFFASLSLLWLTSLLWILNKPSNRVLVWHIVILFLSYTVRYNAMIYPFISIVAMFFSKVVIRRKIASISIVVLLCGLFVLHTGYQYKKLTGVWQYSPFSGWQLANNAMYAYRHVNPGERKPVAKKYSELDRMIREYFDSTRDTKKYPMEAAMASTFYMWSPGMPLVKYKEKIFQKDSSAGDLKQWATMGPIYKDYGIHIIKKYPWHFVKYFIWPNAHKYYTPPVEFLRMYNGGKDSVYGLAQDWFNYNSPKVSTRTKTLKVNILNFYPILSGIVNAVMLFSILFFGMLNGFNKNTNLRKAIYLGGSIWLLNAGFTITASSAALRFQTFPILIAMTFTLLLIDWISSKAMEKKPTENIAQIGSASLTEKTLTTV
ncbi:MAG: hypothetical protein ABI675_02885 [Chitinophagaceae bacterium]